MPRPRNKSARVKTLERKAKSLEEVLRKERELYQLVEAGKLDEEEMTKVGVYKEVYQTLLANGRKGFNSKTYAQYKHLRDTIIDKYENKHKDGIPENGSTYNYIIP